MNSEIIQILKEHSLRFDQMNTRDAVKLIYQNEFGCAHMMNEPQAREYLRAEYEAVFADESAESEQIGEGRCRLNLAKAKALGISVETLFRLCEISANRRGNTENYTQKTQAAIRAIQSGELPFSADELRELSSDCRPVSHSDEFRAAYAPSYRVVDSVFDDILEVIAAADRCRQRGENAVIAIDGCAAAGKSTAAENISRLFGCPVIHADDFFLPRKMRTVERLAQPGGNIHYERFENEVIKNLGNDFFYNVYDCSMGTFSGVRQIEKSDLTVVEGSYCLHPYFGDYAQIKVYMDIDEEKQKLRILMRSGERMLARFADEWIPMEKAYEEYFSIKKKCDIIIGK